jgi:transposase
LEFYRRGGSNRLLDPGAPRGRKAAIPEWAQAKLKQRLSQPRGFGSYGEIQQWLARECGIVVAYHVVHEFVRYRLGAKLKVPRRCAQRQDDEEVEQFARGLGEHLQHLMSHFPVAMPWCYWCEDESRFGLKTIERRRITARGIQPIGIHQWVFETFWLYGAVEPKTGASFFWEFSHLDSLCFERYLEYFSEAYPNQMHLMQVDNSGAHTAVELHVPDNIILLFQPPYAPQLNPIERVWRYLKDRLAWQLWFNRAELVREVEFYLRQLSRSIVASLTGWDFILDALSVAGI